MLKTSSLARRHLLGALMAVLGFGAAGQAHALNCSAAMSDILFGSVTLRTGVANLSTGVMTLSCTNAGALSTVGVCITLGAGSGGAGGSNTPRYLKRADGRTLSYQLRAGGHGAGFGVFNSIYVPVPVILGNGTAALTVYADVTAPPASAPIGTYRSDFTAAEAQITYGVSQCGDSGSTAAISNFEVTADVISSCELDVGSMDFGALPASLNAPVDATGDITLRCSDETPYRISLGLGNGAGVTDPAARKMSSGINSITYGLYQNAARSTPWGDLVSNSVTSTGSGIDRTHQVFGRVHAGQTPATGIYSDAVVVTVEY